MTRHANRIGGRRGPRAARLAALACLGLAACGGKDNGSGQAASSGAAPAGAPVATAAAPSGQQIFQRCAVCHQATGQGIPGSFPPLAGSEWATAVNAAVPIRIVLHGLSGQVTVKGQRFNSAMPPYGTNQPLADSEVAAVLTYVRTSWGNAAGAVTPEQVAAERSATAGRTTPWTAATSRRCSRAARPAPAPDAAGRGVLRGPLTFTLRRADDASAGRGSGRNPGPSSPARNPTRWRERPATRPAPGCRAPPRHGTTG